MYTSDLKLFNSKLDDAVYLCEKRHSPYFFSFFTEEEQALAERHLDSVHFSNYSFFGGSEACERKVLGLFYDEQTDFPVDAILFSFRKTDKLTHRDFLGSLMSLGIERETIGDILFEDGKAVVFVKSEIKDYIMSQISKVGKVGVTLSDADGGSLPHGRGFEEKEYTVSSMRIDNIVSAVSGLSREKSKNLILSGSVSVNHLPCQKTSRNTAAGDKLTIRGKGKFEISGVLGETKKHRIRISIIHYR
ncbi:MAG: YlmH/Sll1252 family protein [Ruminococcus sp.]|nr:YlmH/Sll1252 family protein [Ruminococcus sp.]